MLLVMLCVGVRDEAGARGWARGCRRLHVMTGRGHVWIFTSFTLIEKVKCTSLLLQRHQLLLPQLTHCVFSTTAYEQGGESNLSSAGRAGHDDVHQLCLLPNKSAFLILSSFGAWGKSTGSLCSLRLHSRGHRLALSKASWEMRPSGCH